MEIVAVAGAVAAAYVGYKAARKVGHAYSNTKQEMYADYYGNQYAPSGYGGSSYGYSGHHPSSGYHYSGGHHGGYSYGYR